VINYKTHVYIKKDGAQPVNVERELVDPNGEKKLSILWEKRWEMMFVKIDGRFKD